MAPDMNIEGEKPPRIPIRGGTLNLSFTILVENTGYPEKKPLSHATYHKEKSAGDGI